MQDILNRTSVRKFQTKKIEPEVLKQILPNASVKPLNLFMGI